MYDNYPRKIISSLKNEIKYDMIVYKVDEVINKMIKEYEKKNDLTDEENRRRKELKILDYSNRCQIAYCINTFEDDWAVKYASDLKNLLENVENILNILNVKFDLAVNESEADFEEKLFRHGLNPFYISRSNGKMKFRFQLTVFNEIADKYCNKSFKNLGLKDKFFIMTSISDTWEEMLEDMIRVHLGKRSYWKNHPSEEGMKRFNEMVDEFEE